MSGSPTSTLQPHPSHRCSATSSPTHMPDRKNAPSWAPFSCLASSSPCPYHQTAKTCTLQHILAVRCLPYHPSRRAPKTRPHGPVFCLRHPPDTSPPAPAHTNMQNTSYRMHFLCSMPPPPNPSRQTPKTCPHGHDLGVCHLV